MQKNQKLVNKIDAIMAREQSIVLFDGVCNLCNGVVQFVVKRDEHAHFYFASLESETGQYLLQKYHLPTHNFDSFVLINQHNCYQKSTAALKLVSKLEGAWKALYIFMVVPAFLRDVVYNIIANNRYKWFGKQKQCWMPTPELKQRFL